MSSQPPTMVSLVGQYLTHRRMLGAQLLRQGEQLLDFDSATQVPPAGLMGSPRHRSTPYVYSDQEIRDLIHAARQLNPPEGLRPWTYATLFGLLSCTGLRISEALALVEADVDRRGPIIRIVETKFR
ncbi:MAG: hypothetical protein HYV63_04590 [Candidatus Schekmanbacteria bacterium]|nr:hypothetical protein [Candidatus Schekmanbacteria bacterium]